jgi:hypothetical protein
MGSPETLSPGFGIGRPETLPPGFGIGRPETLPPGFGIGRPETLPPGFGIGRPDAIRTELDESAEYVAAIFRSPIAPDNTSNANATTVRHFDIDPPDGKLTQREYM